MPLCLAAFKSSIQTLTSQVLTDKEILDTFGPSEEGTVARLLPDMMDRGLAMYLAEYERLHPEMCPEPFAGIPQLLAGLRQQGVRLALVTGKGRHSWAISQRQLGLQACFEAVECGNPKGPAKPEGIAGVLKQLGVQRENAIYVGDMVSDIHSSRKAGVRVLAAAWAETADAASLAANDPDYLCETVEEAREALNALSA